MDPIANLAAACEVAHGVVKGVSADKWGAQSPCTEWDARAVANHMIGGLKMATASVAGKPFAHADIMGDLLGDSPAESYRKAADECVAAFKADPSVLGRPVKLPFGEMPGAAVAGLFTNDQFMHAWDLAKATGQSTDLSPALAAGVLDAVKSFVGPELRKPGFFDAEKPVPAGASKADEVAAFLGRNV